MKHFFYIFGIFSACFFLAFIFTYIDSKLWWKFLHNFLNTQILTIIVTFISFNIASITFIIWNLSNIEKQAWKELFRKTRKQFSDNIFFMIWIFIFIFFLLLWLWDAKEINWNSYILYKTILLGLFFLEIFSVIEIFRLILKYKN